MRGQEHIAGQGMYVITEGSVTASVDGNGGASETLQAGATFMSESLAGGGSVAAEATYRSRGCVCVVVDRAMLRDICEYGRERRASSQSELEQRLIKLDDLSVVATLGVGGFGRVKLVRHIKSDSHFALKCMYKGLVIAKRQTEHILNERNLLGMCQHSFLPTLVTTFQDRTQIFVLMELILGGELFSLVATRGRLKEREAAFYVANVTCALEYLHARNIAYRDLKPENLMLDDMGYLKVVDFGFAKVVEDRTFTVCGTPDYLAPETIRRAGHTTTVDWWAMGVLLYELITGQSPFHGGTQMDVLTRIVCGRVPRNNLLSSSAWLMISELLEVDPIRRLGSRVRGRRAVREHTFFAAHVDVDALERKEVSLRAARTAAARARVQRTARRARVQRTARRARVQRTARRARVRIFGCERAPLCPRPLSPLSLPVLSPRSLSPLPPPPPSPPPFRSSRRHGSLRSSRPLTCATSTVTATRSNPIPPNGIAI